MALGISPWAHAHIGRMWNVENTEGTNTVYCSCHTVSCLTEPWLVSMYARKDLLRDECLGDGRKTYWHCLERAGRARKYRAVPVLCRSSGPSMSKGQSKIYLSLSIYLASKCLRKEFLVDLQAQLAQPWVRRDSVISNCTDIDDQIHSWTPRLHFMSKIGPQ